VVSLWDGRVVGVEVLARWHTPDGRVLLPVEFLPLVDDAGLWVDLDEAVLLAALGAGETLPEAVTIGVHMSADSLLRPDLGA
jgi:EAL domain-containing protein (putative c-di-GMP-specific phosphodiesterase class I)